MKINNLTGWKDVFSFTLAQTIKSKAFIISYAIILVIIMVSMPILGMITSKGNSDADSLSPIKKVYINNETTLPNMDFKEVLKDKNLSHISFEPMKEDYSVVSSRIEEKEQDSVILSLKEEVDKYSLEFVRGSKGSVSEGNLQVLADSVKNEFENFKVNTLKIRDDQIAILKAKVTTKVLMANVNGTEIVKEDTSISGNEYWFIYGILFAILMVNIMASSQIASSIVTEKSTRVLEYLLTSVKPLSLMLGKILAMLTVVIVEGISLIIAFLISNRVSNFLFSNSKKSLIAEYLPKDLLQNLNPINVLFCLLLIILGMIFYATLAGLAGACVSRLEELNEGLTLFTLTNIVGAYIGMGAAGVLMGKGINSFVIFSFLFPLSSVFLLPGAILIGKVTLPLVVAAVGLQLVFIALLFKFVAKVYETLILHNGNNIKFKELIKIWKTV